MPGSKGVSAILRSFMVASSSSSEWKRPTYPLISDEQDKAGLDAVICANGTLKEAERNTLHLLARTQLYGPA